VDSRALFCNGSRRGGEGAVAGNKKANY